MTAFLLYIIKLSCCLTLFYAGYKLLLSNETFFRFNRKVLLTGMLVCMLLPMIQIKTETAGMIHQPMIQLERMMFDLEEAAYPLIENEAIAQTVSASSQKTHSFSVVHLLVFIFATGCFVYVCMLIRSHISLYILLRKGRKIKRDTYTIVLFDKAVTPFNYGSYIILSEKDYRENADTILTHELAHFRFLHSFDIALIEFLTLLQWFNPIVRLLKKEIRYILVFWQLQKFLKQV
jgi:hypothetical protein